MRASPGAGLRRLAAAVAVFMALVLWAGTAAADPPVWRIHGRNAEVTLFGSVHLLSDQTRWRTPSLLADLAAADQVWFEIPLDPESRVGGEQAVRAAGLLPPNQRLSALLPPRTRARLASTLDAMGLPLQGFEPLRPWLAETLLTLADLQRHGAREGLGVEEQISAEAPATASRQAFETAQEQVQVLAAAPLAEQVSSLDETLHEIAAKPNAFERLERAWADGDTAWIARETLDPMRRSTPGLYRRMVADRNRRFADRIERLLQGSGKAFIVVGVGHLIGPDGVPALLRRKGVVVEGP